MTKISPALLGLPALLRLERLLGAARSTQRQGTIGNISVPIEQWPDFWEICRVRHYDMMCFEEFYICHQCEQPGEPTTPCFCPESVECDLHYNPWSHGDHDCSWLCCTNNHAIYADFRLVLASTPWQFVRLEQVGATPMELQFSVELQLLSAKDRRRLAILEYWCHFKQTPWEQLELPLGANRKRRRFEEGDLVVWNTQSHPSEHTGCVICGLPIWASLYLIFARERAQLHLICCFCGARDAHPLPTHPKYFITAKASQIEVVIYHNNWLGGMTGAMALMLQEKASFALEWSVDLYKLGVSAKLQTAAGRMPPPRNWRLFKLVEE